MTVPSDIAVANQLVQRMVGLRVEGCFVWMDVQLQLDDDFSIRATEFVLEGPDGDAEIQTEQNPSSVAPLLGLMRVARVTAAGVTEPGDLTVAFDTGHSFKIECDPHYEGWQISGADDLLIVALPGGDVSVWEPGGGNVARGGKGEIWTAET